MYLVFAILAAFIGGGLSIYMRMELMEPGVQYMADGHVWNVFTTAHGLIMVFFVVMPGLIGGCGRSPCGSGAAIIVGICWCNNDQCRCW